MKMLAHSTNRLGEDHDLVEHLRKVAAMAREFAGEFGPRELACWAGLP